MARVFSMLGLDFPGWNPQTGSTGHDACHLIGGNMSTSQPAQIGIPLALLRTAVLVVDGIGSLNF